MKLRPLSDEELKAELPKVVDLIKGFHRDASGPEETLRVFRLQDRRTQEVWYQLIGMIEAVQEEEEEEASSVRRERPKRSGSPRRTSGGSSTKETSMPSKLDGTGRLTSSRSTNFSTVEAMRLAALKPTDAEIRRLFPQLKRIGSAGRERQLRGRAMGAIVRVAAAAREVVEGDRAARVAQAGALRLADARRLVELESRRELACRQLAEEIDLLDAVALDVERSVEGVCPTCRKVGFVDDGNRLTGECCGDTP